MGLGAGLPEIVRLMERHFFLPVLPGWGWDLQSGLYLVLTGSSGTGEGPSCMFVAAAGVHCGLVFSVSCSHSGFLG